MELGGEGGIVNKAKRLKLSMSHKRRRLAPGMAPTHTHLNIGPNMSEMEPVGCCPVLAGRWEVRSGVLLGEFMVVQKDQKYGFKKFQRPRFGFPRSTSRMLLKCQEFCSFLGWSFRKLPHESSDQK
jgi:hypothetical protein